MSLIEVNKFENFQLTPSPNINYLMDYMPNISAERKKAISKQSQTNLGSWFLASEKNVISGAIYYLYCAIDPDGKPIEVVNGTVISGKSSSLALCEAPNPPYNSGTGN